MTVIVTVGMAAAKAAKAAIATLATMNTVLARVAVG
jgi:hypothetical protein